MGVIQLWQILAPVKTQVALTDLRGRTLAVDLSIWVCESNAVRQMQGVVLKPHLRNLFFRVSNLTQMGIQLIFVIDGEAPELKRDTMAKRQQARNPGKAKPASGITKPKRKGRSQFNTILKECCELLNYLGVPYIYSQGEAEAMCAVLNREGIADGCLTEDGDAFLYGAKKVYRNFTLATKDPHLESYSSADIEETLGLRQEGLVGLALLLGCDYLPKGVPGVGKEQVLKLIKRMEGVNVLERFVSWQSEDGGNLDGIEKAVWKKAMKVEGFPNTQVINEFMVVKDSCIDKEFRQRRPWIQKLQDFLQLKIDWPVEYTEEKVLPLITLWDMRDIIRCGQHRPALHLIPNRVVKRRVRQGVPCLEIEWIRQDSGTEENPYYTTIEEEDMFTKCFSGTVELFEEAEMIKKTSKVQKKKKVEKCVARSPDQDIDGVAMVTESLGNLDLDSKQCDLNFKETDVTGSKLKSKPKKSKPKSLPADLVTERTDVSDSLTVSVKSKCDVFVANCDVSYNDLERKLNRQGETIGVDINGLISSNSSESVSSDEESLPEYMPLSQRIKMSAVNNRDENVKTCKEEDNVLSIPKSNTCDRFKTEKLLSDLKFGKLGDETNRQTVEMISTSCPISEGESDDYLNESTEVAEKTCPAIDTVHPEMNDSHVRGDNSSEQPSTRSPACETSHSGSDVSNDFCYNCDPSPDYTNPAVSSKHVRVTSVTKGSGEEAVTVISIAWMSPCHKETRTKSDRVVDRQPVVSLSPACDGEDNNFNYSTNNDSVDLFSPALDCGSPLHNAKKFRVNDNVNFSSPDLNSGKNKCLNVGIGKKNQVFTDSSALGCDDALHDKKKFLVNPNVNISSPDQNSENNKCFSLEIGKKDRVFTDSPGSVLNVPELKEFIDISLLGAISTPQAALAKPLSNGLFDSPDMCGNSPSYGCFNLESSLLNLTADSSIRNPLTPITCINPVAKVKVKPSVDCSELKTVEPEAEDVTVEEPDTSLLSASKDSICIVLPQKNAFRDKILSHHSDNTEIRTNDENENKAFTQKHQQISRNESSTAISSKENSRHSKHRLRLPKNKAFADSDIVDQCNKENPVKRIEEKENVLDDHFINSCIEDISKLQICESNEDVKPSSPLALADRLKSKLDSFTASQISCDTILNVKKIKKTSLEL